MPDASPEVAIWLPWIKDRAWRLAARNRWSRAEFDDLTQEGMIAVYNVMLAGHNVNSEDMQAYTRKSIRNRMVAYCQWEARHRSTHISYDEVLAIGKLVY